MSMALRRTIAEALGADAAAPDATPHLWKLMRRKSAAERDAIRAACAAVRAAVTTMAQVHRRGDPVTSVILAGERAANDAGAQDVRTLYNADGGRALSPFTCVIGRAIDRFQVYVAVQRFNYWAEGFVCFTTQPSAVIQKANALLTSALEQVKAGSSVKALAQGIEAARGPYQVHPVAERAAVAPVGLALEEPPNTDPPDAFEAGEVYSIRIGLTDGEDQHAIVSAMIAVGDNGNELLWTAAVA
jgi:hypothetical protein